MRTALKILGFFYVIILPLAAQTCAKQPAISLDNIEEWACKGMDYEQAWDALTSNQIAPVRNANVTVKGTTVNYNSRKSKLIRGLQIAGFATMIAGGVLANNGNLSDLQLTLLLGGPKATEEGIRFFSGAPDTFVMTPPESGFVTIYSGPTSQQIVRSAVAPAPVTTQPAAPGFVPSTWLRLYRDSRAQSRDVVVHWRAVDASWLQEELRWENEQRLEMNEAEREALEFIQLAEAK